MAISILLSPLPHNGNVPTYTTMVQALSRSLAATQKIVFTFFSSCYLDVSVHRLTSFVYILLIYGFSHSDILAFSFMCNYTKLFAAYHVLLRLLLPRHPPYALSQLLFYFFILTLLSCECCFSFTYYSFLIVLCFLIGGDKQDRTADLRSASAALSQLSYIPIACFFMVGMNGLEPSTPALSAQCSNHLSYTPINFKNKSKQQLKCLYTPQKGGDPSAPSGTDTLLRLHPNHYSHLHYLPPYGQASNFRCKQLSWCDGRCVQGPRTYSPQHC